MGQGGKEGRAPFNYCEASIQAAHTPYRSWHTPQAQLSTCVQGRGNPRPGHTSSTIQGGLRLSVSSKLMNSHHTLTPPMNKHPPQTNKQNKGGPLEDIPYSFSCSRQTNESDRERKKKEREQEQRDGYGGMFMPGTWLCIGLRVNMRG